MNKAQSLTLGERLARYRHIGQIELGSAAMACVVMIGEVVTEKDPRLVAFTGITSFVLAAKGLANIAGANNNGSLQPILARNLPQQQEAAPAGNQ